MFSKVFYLLVFVSFASKYTNAQRNLKYFRKDYTYIQSLESFYKIHTRHRTLTDAVQVCSEEGATLFDPRSQRDTLEFISVLEFFNGTQTSITIKNGISNVITEGVQRETFDGIPISQLYSNWSPGDNSEYPFICKKTLETVDWNQECNIPILGYTYSEDTGRCYKFHLDPMNWTDAYNICKQEQSYLAILNSNEEARFLVKLTESVPKESIMGNYLSGITHLGFRKENDQWMTIDGVKLEDSGYPKWNGGQPDGPSRGVDEPCGSMFYNGELNDIGCQARSFFICEHEIGTLASLGGYRLGES